MTKTSAWVALQNPAFKRLWIASVISGTWVAANDTAATWMMHVLTPSPFFLSLMSTMASLPFFFFTLPAGAIADVMDRKKVLCLMNLWLAAGAAGLAILGQLHLLSPYAILACIFLTGVGFAFNAPTWASIVPEIVSDAELPSAVALGGLQLNISGIIGPILGGALILLIGADFVFVVNAACFLFVIRAVLSWKGTTERSRLPLESFFESFVTGIRYVRYATGLQIVLARNALFALCISVIPALMPVVGLKVLCLSPSSLGLLFTSMGVGSVVAAVAIIPWLRARYTPNTVTILANLLLLLVYLSMALVRHRELFFFMAALAGVGWTVSACELWVAAQRAMPNWARGRMNATVIMISQGAMAFGGVIWGFLVAAAGVNYALLAATIPLLISLALAARLSINFTKALNFDPAPTTNLSQPVLYALQPDHGPVSVAVEFKVDCTRRREFLSLMQEIRLMHLRNGAHGWGLHEDLNRSNTFRLEMMVLSWNNYLLQLARITKAEQEILEKAWGLHIGTSPPEARTYLSIRREMCAHKRCEEASSIELFDKSARSRDSHNFGNQATKW
jgi:MFS family permease